MLKRLQFPKVITGYLSVKRDGTHYFPAFAFSYSLFPVNNFALGSHKLFSSMVRSVFASTNFYSLYKLTVSKGQILLTIMT